LDRLGALQGSRFALADRGRDRGNDLFGFVCFWRPGLDSFVNASFAIDIRGAKIRAAKVNGTDEIGFGFFASFQ
jgi:hypothetical protein